METAAKVTCQPHSVSANYITMGSKIRPPRPQIRLHLCKNRPYCAKLGYVQTMWCHSQKSMKRAGNGHCQPHPAAANDITMGSKIRLPRPQIRLHLSQNRLCCSKLGYVSAMGCHSRAQSPGTSTNHTNHMARHEVYSTFVSTRLLHTFVSPICYQTHTHTAHQCNTAQGKFKEFEWTTIMPRLLFCPPGFVDLPSKPTHTHKHTLANAPWPTCVLFAAMRSPTCPVRDCRPALISRQ
jgi:hypothetical protein